MPGKPSNQTAADGRRFLRKLNRPDAENAKENDSLTAKVAKGAEERKSFTAKDAEGAKRF